MDVFPVRTKSRGTRGHGKETPQTPAITAFVAIQKRDNERSWKRFERDMTKEPKHPHNRRGTAFCWLWDNYDGVQEVIRHNCLTWIGVAWLANMDGVKGCWGEPVTANVLRRVFVRVTAELEVKWAKEAVEEEEREGRAAGSGAFGSGGSRWGGFEPHPIGRQ